MKYSKYPVILLPIFLLSLFSCSSEDQSSKIKESMQHELDLYFDKTKTGKINKEKFYLEGAVLFGMEPGDYDFRKLRYDFGENQYFSLTYKEEFGLIEQKDIFNNKLLKSSPGYVGQVLSFPNDTTVLNCAISFSYKQYTVTNNLKVTFLGGEEAIMSLSGWTKVNENKYTYLFSSTVTDTIDRPISVSKSSGIIDLSNLTLFYSSTEDIYHNGVFSSTAYTHSYDYDANSGTVNVGDGVYERSRIYNSINTKRQYNSSKYYEDKENGWDWKILSSFMSPLKTFEKLLNLRGYGSYTSVFCPDNYYYEYLFGMSKGGYY